MLILETPPAVEQPERERRECLDARQFLKEKPAAAPEKPLRVGDRFRDATGRVQHVRGDHQIECAAREILPARMLLDVQRRETNEGIVAPETLLSLAKERRGNIRVDVLGLATAPTDRFEHRLRRPAGSGADLQNAKDGTRSESVAVGRHRSRHLPLQQLRLRITVVNRTDEIHRTVREEDVGGGLLAANDRRERFDGCREEPCMRSDRRMFRIESLE